MSSHHTFANHLNFRYYESRWFYNGLGHNTLHGNDDEGHLSMPLHSTSERSQRASPAAKGVHCQHAECGQQRGTRQEHRSAPAWPRGTAHAG